MQIPIDSWKRIISRDFQKSTQPWTDRNSVPVSTRRFLYFMYSLTSSWNLREHALPRVFFSAQSNEFKGVDRRVLVAALSLSLLDLYGESLTTTKTANKPSRSDTMICARRASLSPFPFAWVPVTYLTQRKEREPVATKEKEREKWEDQRKTAPYWLVLLFCSREIGDDLRPSLWMSLHFLFPFAYSLWYLVRDCYVSFRFNLAFDILNAGPFTHQDVTRKGSKTSKQLQRRGKEAPFRASALLLIQSATKKSVAWSNCVCSFSLF